MRLPLSQALVERPLPQKLVDRLVRELEEPAPLSDREIDVLALLACGYRNPEIAKTLYISSHTVLSHMARIRSKLGAKTVAHAVALSITRGYLDRSLIR
jgi:DNA-binding CsgD family transcriptional regulator